ncbi:F-box protein CPR1 [Linum grandiflorum]
MADLIPPEIMVDILLLLRVKDLVNCRRVSKQWLSIIDDPHFIGSQLECALSNPSNSTIFLHDRKSQTQFWKPKNASDISLSFSTPTHNEPSFGRLIGSCHGLVCFSLSNHQRNPDFVILNPSTGERHTLTNPSKEVGRIGNELKACGFGYDELLDDYKVVRILETRSDDPHNMNPSYTAEIYGVRSKGFFTTIPLPTTDWRYRIPMSMGVFFGSSLHWDTWSKVSGYMIHAIDLASNTYRRKPVSKIGSGPHIYFRNLGILDRSLCLCGILEGTFKIGIWNVREEYENFEAWNMIYYIDPSCFARCVFYVGSNGEKILLMTSWDIFVWYDPTEKNACTKKAKKKAKKKALKWLKIKHVNSNYCDTMYCLESLVKILPKEFEEEQSRGFPLE